MSAPQLPVQRLYGRLAGGQSMADDERMDPRAVRAMVESGLAGAQPPPVSAASPLAAIHAYYAEAERTYAQLLAPLVPCYSQAVRLERRSAGQVQLLVFDPRPAQQATVPCPAIIQLHGGGMAITTADMPYPMGVAGAMAELTGCLVVAVDFVNTTGRLGNHPFPAALDQCCAAVAWLADHKRDLNVSSIIITGQSGGGNLCLATALKLKSMDKAHLLDGVFASCPFIGGPDEYAADKPAPYLCMLECDGYWADRVSMAIFARLYDPLEQHTQDPLAWPLLADVEQLRGLMPHVICVQELDPVRDQGIGYYRKLTAAGVQAQCLCKVGLFHNADMLVANHAPDIFQAAISAVGDFAKRLANCYREKSGDSC